MRRRVAGGVLVVLVGVLLALRWYDDGTVRRSGLLLLTPIHGRPDDVPGLGWARLAAALAILTGLAAVALLPRLRPAPAWTTRLAGPAGPSPAGAGGAGRTRRDPGPWWAAGFAGASAVAAGLAAWRLGGLATSAVPAAAVVLAGTAAGVPLAVLGRGRRALVPGTALAAVVALGVTLGAPWYAEGRHVQRTETAAAAPANPDAGPATPGRVAWTRTAARTYAGGGYVALAEDLDGPGLRVSVVDAATGAERWSYRHDDSFVSIRIGFADGVLLLRRNQDGAFRLLAFDLASGRPLWTRSTEAVPLDDGAGFDEDRPLLPAGVLVVGDRDTLTGLDPRTGEQRWSRPNPVRCTRTPSVTRAGDVLLLTGVCRSRTVVALRADSGDVAWTTAVSDEDGFTRAPGRVPVVSGDTVVLDVTSAEQDVPEQLVALDVGTGAVRWRRDWRPAVLPPVLVAGRYVTVEIGPTRAGGRRGLVAVARDVRTGATAWTSPLPADTAAAGAPSDDVERVTGSDGTRFYLLSGPSAGPVRLDVLDGSGRPAGGATLPGCTDRQCAGAVVPVTGVTSLAPGGGALVVLTAGAVRPVAVIADGPAYRPVA